MPRKKLNYREGDWCAVPVDGGGYAIGLIARVRPGGKILLGYFFGPRRRKLPARIDQSKYAPESTILIKQFGDLGILAGHWPIISHSERWQRKQWPIPFFVTVDSITGTVSLVEYSDALDEIRVICRPDVDPSDYPKDGLAGCRAIEIRLRMLLSTK